MENIHLNSHYDGHRFSPCPTARMPRDIFDDISEKNNEESSGEYARNLIESYEMDLPDDDYSNCILTKQFKFIEGTQDL